MRRSLLLLVALLCGQAANAQMFVNRPRVQMRPVLSVAGPVVSALSALVTDSFTTIATVASYSKTANLGAASADRMIVVATGNRSGSTANAGSVTVGGVSLTLANEVVNGSNEASLWYGMVPTGTSATVTVNWVTANPVRGGFVVYTVRGASSLASSGTNFNGGTLTALNVTLTPAAPSILIATSFTGTTGGQRFDTASAVVPAGSATTTLTPVAASAPAWSGVTTAADFDNQITTSNAGNNVLVVAAFN